MPCNSDYMDATGPEIAMSRVYQLHDELDGKKIDPSGWRGYDRRAYGAGLSKEQCDALVSGLCERLQKVDVTQYSLEMQMWWRDHQAADADRIKREKAEAKAKELRKAALAKLSPAERKALKV